MLSQLPLRFHKKLIEALKMRAGHEDTSVKPPSGRWLLSRQGYSQKMLASVTMVLFRGSLES